MHKDNKFPIKPNHPALIKLGVVLILIVFFVGDFADPLAMGVVFLFIEIQDRYYAARVKDLDERLAKVDAVLKAMPGPGDSSNSKGSG